MSKSGWVLLSVAMLLGTTALGHGATYYVSSTTGDDARSCATATNIATPRRTIGGQTPNGGGIQCLAPGDTLYIRAGEYVEQVFARFGDNSPATPITIRGYPGDATRPVIKPLLSSLWAGNGGAVDLYWPSGQTTIPKAYLRWSDIDVDFINVVDGTTDVQCILNYLAEITIERTDCVNSTRNGHSLFQGEGATGVLFRNNTVRNCGAHQPEGLGDTKGPGIYTIGSGITIEDNLFDGCRAGGLNIQYDESHDIIVRRNIIRNFGGSSPWGCVPATQTGGHGILIGQAGYHGPYGPYNIRIENNYIYHGHSKECPLGGNTMCFAFTGSDGTHGSQGANYLVHNTCDDVERKFFSGCGTASSGQIVQNNIFSRMTDADILCGPLDGTFTPNLVNPTLAATFVNATTRDYHLIEGSTAIDAGVTLGLPVTEDYDRQPRPTGAGVDMGADEFAGPVTGLRTPQLYVYWRFDEGGIANVTDDSGVCQCDGILVGGPTWVPGRLGNALQFNGSGQTVTYDTLVWPAGQPVTVEFWIKTAGGTPSGTFGMGTSDHRLAAHVPWSDNILYWDYGVGFTTNRISTDFTPYLNQWTHVALVGNATDFRAIYINGVLRNSNTVSATPSGTLTGLAVGRYRVTGNLESYQTGILDDFRLYTYVRSASEIAADYRQGAKAPRHLHVLSQ